MQFDKLMAVCLMLCLTACGGQNEKTAEATPSPISVLSPTITSTVSFTPSLEPILSPTVQSPTDTPIASFVFIASPMPIGDSNYHLLHPGQYVLYESTEENGILFISLDGTYQGKLIDMNLADELIYPGARKLVYGSYEWQDLHILDLEQNIITEIPTYGCDYGGISPDERKVILRCGENQEMCVQFLAENRQVCFDVTSREDSPHYTFWSPDGKWIAYTILERVDGPPAGLYLLDVSCLASPETCPSRTLGPYRDNVHLFGPYLWSPDSSSLIFLSDHLRLPFKIFDLQSRKFNEMAIPGENGLIGLFAWSQDGKWIAYSRHESTSSGYTDEDINLVSVDDGEVIHLLDKPGDQYVFSWLTVPLPSNPGDLYTITDAGADLNLRGEPSLDGEILRKLQPRDIVTILDGPVEADGYTWWQMQAEDGVTGWAVNIPEWYEMVQQ
jgi:hypothetical protein